MPIKSHCQPPPPAGKPFHRSRATWLSYKVVATVIIYCPVTVPSHSARDEARVSLPAHPSTPSDTYFFVCHISNLTFVSVLNTQYSTTDSGMARW